MGVSHSNTAFRQSVCPSTCHTTPLDPSTAFNRLLFSLIGTTRAHSTPNTNERKYLILATFLKRQKKENKKQKTEGATDVQYSIKYGATLHFVY
jgi:hypothetical protein